MLGTVGTTKTAAEPANEQLRNERVVQRAVEVDRFAGVAQATRELMNMIPGYYQPFPDGLAVGLCEYDSQIASFLAQQRNQHNRHEIKSNTKFLERVISGELWRLTGETLIFDRDGFLRNGGHRMRSLAKLPGKKIKSFTVFGVDPESFKAMDQGTKRGVCHALGIDGEVNTTTVAAAIVCLQSFMRSGKPYSKLSIRLSVEENIQVFERYPGLRDSAALIKTKPFRCFQIPGMTTCLHYLFGLVSSVKRDEFFSGMINMNMPMDQPKWCGPRAFRSNLDNYQKHLEERNEYPALLIKAWNWFNEEKAGVTFRWRGDRDAFPLIWGWDYDSTGKPIGTETFRF